MGRCGLNGSDAQHCEDRSGVDPVKRCAVFFHPWHRHAKPRIAAARLMWSSARFRRSANVLGLWSVAIQKSLKNCRTIWRRRSISCLLGEASNVMPIAGSRAGPQRYRGQASSAMVSTVSLAAFGSELPLHERANCTCQAVPQAGQPACPS
jgi:hypothetical protein